MNKWSDVYAIIEARKPELREIAKQQLELEERMRKAGIPVPPLPPILAEAYRCLGLQPAGDAERRDG